jgi:hypothetical protein
MDCLKGEGMAHCGAVVPIFGGYRTASKSGSVPCAEEKESLNITQVCGMGRGSVLMFSMMLYSFIEIIIMMNII